MKHSNDGTPHRPHWHCTYPNCFQPGVAHYTATPHHPKFGEMLPPIRRCAAHQYTIRGALLLGWWNEIEIRLNP